MELQFKNRVCACLGRAMKSGASQEVTQEVKLTEAMPDVGSVLTAWGQMIIRSKEWRGDTVRVSGGVMVWILYAPEDGGAPRCVDAWVPYQLRWDHVDGEQEGPVRVSPVLRFVDARNTSLRKLMIRVGAAAMAEGFYPKQVALYSPEELPEDIQIRRRTYPIRLMKEAGEKSYSVEDVLHISGEKASDILSYTVNPGITDCRVLGNRVVFRGNCNLHLVYCGKDGRLRTTDFEIPFAQFEELENTYGPDAVGDIRFAVTNMELEQTEDNSLNFKCGLVGQYLVDDLELIEVVEDAYSPLRNVQVKHEMPGLTVILEQREETIEINENLPGCTGELVDVDFLPDIPKLRWSGEEVTVDTPGSFQLLCYGEEGSLQSSGGQWERSMTIPADSGIAVSPELVAMERPQVIPGADHWELKGKILMKTSSYSESGIQMVSALEIDETEKDRSDCPALILCRADHENLWQLAKRCGSTVEAIRSANGLGEDEENLERLLLIPIM